MPKKSTLLTELLVASAVFHGIIVVALGIFAISTVVADDAEFEAVEIEDQEPEEVIVKVPDLSTPQVNMPMSRIAVDAPDLDLPQSDFAVPAAQQGVVFGAGFGKGALQQIDFKPSSFFGLSGGGERIAYIVDYSLSMGSGQRDPLMRTELIRSLEQLDSQTQVALVFFAGPYWVAEDDIRRDADNWTIPRQGNRLAGFEPRSGWTPSQPEWKDVGRSRGRLIRRIKETPLVIGTDWAVAFEPVLKMDPLPETIFFLTDGAVGRNDGIVPITRMIEELRSDGKTVPIINTIGLEVGGAANDLREIAEMTGGEYVAVDGNSYEAGSLVEAEVEEQHLQFGDFPERDGP